MRSHELFSILHAIREKIHTVRIFDEVSYEFGDSDTL